MATLAHVEEQDRVKPQMISKAGSLLLEISNKQEATMVYNNVAIALVWTMASPPTSITLGATSSYPHKGTQTT